VDEARERLGLKKPAKKARDEASLTDIRKVYAG